MPLHPTVASILRATAHLPKPPQLPLAEARAGFRQRTALLPRPEVQLARVEDIELMGMQPALPARLYVPVGTIPAPLLVFFHGGGFVLGDLDTHDGLCRRLCAASACVVLSVDYRLAPEHPFPVPADDCWNATRWAAQHAARLGADHTRIVVVGDSAGGTLAASTALRSRDLGGPALRAQVLIYPALAHYTANTDSYTELAEGYGLTRASMVWFWDQYLRTEMHRSQPYAVPAATGNMSGLPPALVITAEYDLLRDEGESYARALSAAGVVSRVVRFDGMNHGFAGLGGIVDAADQAICEVARWLGQVVR